MLREIPEPPAQMYIRGTYPVGEQLFLSIVGSRKYSSYGKEVCEYLVRGLAGNPVVIVSGLALGIDAIAHRAALDAGLTCVGVPSSGLADDVLYPRSNVRLAHEILQNGGCLLSEYKPDTPAAPWTFPQRNRIMVGLSHAVLMIEAGEKSGTLITARLTADYNRELLVVPHPIFSEGSKGNHQFLKLGATLVTSPDDVLAALGIERVDREPPTLTPMEQRIYDALATPCSRSDLVESLSLPMHELGSTLTMMEIQGVVAEENGLYRRVV